MNRIRVLLIDDEPDKLKIFKLRLGTLKDDFIYDVETVDNGRDGLELLKVKEFDLVLLDLSMPMMDGYEVLRRIRNNIQTRNIPVIILTASTDVMDEIRSLDMGADDFLCKESEKEIIQLRIRNVLKKHHFMLGLNPLTHLPGNLQIEHEIQQRIETNMKFAICYVDLDHFKEFNDHFGFKMGDEAIKLTAKILRMAIDREGNPSDFLGHIGGDDFVLITTPENVTELCEWIVSEAEREFPNLFPEDVRSRGYYLAENRKGLEEQIPLLSISIGVVHNQYRPLNSIPEVASVASEVKKKAKQINGNSFYIDQRKG